MSIVHSHLFFFQFWCASCLISCGRQEICGMNCVLIVFIFALLFNMNLLFWISLILELNFIDIINVQLIATDRVAWLVC